MTTNKPINILEMNDDILQLIQTELIVKRKFMDLKLQKKSLIQVINNMHIFFKSAGFSEDFDNGESDFSEWLLNDADSDSDCIYWDARGLNIIIKF